MQSMHILFLLSLSISSIFPGNDGEKQWNYRYKNVLQLIENTTNSKVAIDFVNDAINSENFKCFGFSVLIELVKKRQLRPQDINDTMDSINSKNLQTNDRFYYSLFLTELVRQGQCFSKAISFIEDSPIIEKSLHRHETDLKLLIELVEQRQYMSQAMKYATYSVKRKEWFMQKYGLEVFIKLVKHGQGIEQAQTIINDILFPPFWKRIPGLGFLVPVYHEEVWKQACTLHSLIKEKKCFKAKL